MKTYTDEHAEARKDFLAALDGLTYAATFIPQSVSRNAGEKDKSLNWRIRLARQGTELVTDYSQGIGHVPGYVHNLPRTLYLEPVQKAWEAASETGKYPVGMLWKKKHEHGECWEVNIYYKTALLPQPEMEDVLYSLVSDASAVQMTFDEWCAEYGFDTDSRKAHAAYMQCSDIGLRLARIVGGFDRLQRLEELYQGF